MHLPSLVTSLIDVKCVKCDILRLTSVLCDSSANIVNIKSCDHFRNSRSQVVLVLVSMVIKCCQ